ncbi:hypothetical protein MKW98_010896, partial [Papaver atlanticum]
FDSGRDVAVLLEVNRGDSIHHDFESIQRKSFKSAKVHSALSWSWSSKSFQSNAEEEKLGGCLLLKLRQVAGQSIIRGI